MTISEARSLRSEMTWKTSSAAPSGRARYPSSSTYADIGIVRPRPTPRLCRQAVCAAVNGPLSMGFVMVSLIGLSA